MSETKVNLGFLPVNRGTYSNSATYYKDNIVQYNGSSYICTQDPGSGATPQGITGEVPYVSQPDVPNTHWAVFVNNQGGPVEGIYDVSANHATDNTPKAYDSLSAALADVPTAKKTGGLVVKFIQTTPATYNVVKTEGVTELPTGTLLDSASSIASGTYTASQLTDFATLPTESAVTYYVAVTEDETTTYTSWVITKATNDFTEYVQYRYMKTATTSATFTNVANWQGVDDEPTAGSDNLVKSRGVYNSINSLKQNNFTITKGYIDSDGELQNSNFLYATDYIPVDKNTDFLRFYNGITTAYAYLAFYDANKSLLYSYLLRASVESELSYGIPKDAVYVRVTITDLAKFYLRFIDIKNNIAVRCFGVEDYDLQLTEGYYIKISNGQLTTGASYFYSQIIDVQAGDVFTLTANVSDNVSVLSEWDSNGNFIKSLVGGTGSATTYYYVIEKPCRVRVCSIRTSRNLNFHLFKNKVYTHIANLSDKVSQYDKLVLQPIVPSVASSLVITKNQLTSVPDSNYKVAYYTATKACKLAFYFTRNNSYTHDGRVSIINGSVVANTSTTTLYQFDYDETLHTFEVNLSLGQTVGIGYMPTDVLQIKIFDYDVVNEIKEELDDQEERISEIEGQLVFYPTDFSNGDMSAFKKILCIGDSLTYGVFNHDDIQGETWEQPIGYSYPDNLKRISGCDTFNTGISGITSAGWYAYYSHQSHPERQEAISGFDCCIIFLGTNDDVETLNTVSREAFINIISLVKTLNKQIKIFLSGMINAKSYPINPGNDYEIKDNFLRALYAELYANDEQVFFLDMKAYSHLRDLENIPSSNYPLDNWNMGHLSAYGYWRLARDYYNYISYIMAKDLTNTFRDIQFTGTDYKYKGY